MGDMTQHAENPFKTVEPAVNSLKTVSADQLQKADIPPLRFIVDRLLPEGLSMLVAPPKFGKSWFSLGLCIAVSSGKPFLGHSTDCADVLYLALEDSFRRLKSRQELLLQGATAPDNLHFAVAAGTLDGMLNVQLEEFMKSHPKTGLVIIDVLARVRSQVITPKSDAYKMDYAEMGAIKALADKYHIAILVVHHTRKMRDDADVFNTVSGSNGLSGCADATFVLCKEKRSDNRATLHIIGRDVEASEFIVEMGGDCQWRLIGSSGEVTRQNTLHDFCSMPIVRLIRKKLEAASGAEMRTTSEELKDDMIESFGTCGNLDSAKKIGRFLSDATNIALFAEIGIECHAEKTPTARWRTFRRLEHEET